MARKSALLVVDPQNDFCPGGALGVPHGDAVVPVLDYYMEAFRRAMLPIFASRDWHPPQTRHFTTGGGQWPPHCVQGTKGAEFHPDLRLPEGAIIISKGIDPQEDSYSAFDGRDNSGTPLLELLRQRGVERLYVGGLATDYCVRYTTLDALRHGLEAWVLADASRGVDLKAGDSERAVAEMRRAGAKIATLAEVLAELGTVGQEGAD
ncbi:MAG: bifunctional nicotinamidase/pyrazinamidase [Chloroflexi bacterium]|nr:bifunctional nicotinamidase/pyrazinamidase [Chloroflexota bacterium]